MMKADAPENVLRQEKAKKLGMTKVYHMDIDQVLGREASLNQKQEEEKPKRIDEEKIAKGHVINELNDRINDNIDVS